MNAKSVLNLETFLKAGADGEANQLFILGRLKWYYDEFAHNRLFPALTELIELTLSLRTLLHEYGDLQEKLPQELRDIDVEKRRLVFQRMEDDGSELKRIIDLVFWTMPHLERAVEEGRRICEFVEENIQVEQVGIGPMYQEEGYYFIPEHRASLLHLHRYQVSLYTTASERFRTLKLRLIRSLKQAFIRPSPATLKLELIETHDDLPNPATYVCETDLEFPFVETILPLAKRKLLARVYS